MKNNKRKKTPPANLRDRAEQELNEKEAKAARSTDEAETKRLVHELHVHQIELEMQNEELTQSRAATEAMLAAYSDLYDFAPAGYFTLTPDGTIRQANLAGANLLGLPRAKLVGRRFDAFVSGPHRPDFTAFLTRIFAGEAKGTKETCEAVLIDIAGVLARPVDATSERVVRIEAAAVEDGQTCRAVAIDITDSRRAEVFTRTRLALLEFATSHSLDELMQETVDQAGVLTGSPVGFYHFVDADQQSLTLQAWSTRTVAEFCKAEGKGRHYGIDEAGVWTDCVRTKSPVIHNDYASLPHRKGLPPGHAPVIRELVVPVTKRGRIVSILGVGNKSADYTDADVQAVSFVADVVWEIIKRKRAEDELRVKEQAVRGSINAIHLADLQGRVTYINPAFAKLWNIASEADAVGKPIADFFAGNVKSREAGTALRATGSYFGELTARRPDGTEFEVQASGSAVKDDAGATIGFAGSFVDITERKLIEKTQLFLARRGFGETDEDFFRSLARHLAETLAMDSICIDRLSADGLSAHTVALLHDGEFRENMTYPLPDTPCGEVVGKTSRSFPTGVREAFPKNERLQRLLLDSYIGTTLWDFAGKPLGLIALGSRKPCANVHVAESILQLVAPRVAGELERRQAEQALKTANAELEARVRQRTVELEKRAAQLSDLAHKLSQAEIDERKTLAQFLHDDLQQLLVAAKLAVAAAAAVAGGDAHVRQSLEKGVDLLNRSLTASRTLTAEISPPVLQDGNLTDILRWIARWARERHGLNVELHLDEEVDARHEIRVLLFRIIRELLFNVVKHAGVDRAEVVLARADDGGLAIVVRDRGKGFDADLAKDANVSKSGFGLFSIQERLQWIGGRYEIVTAPGAGTAISLFAPIG
jgi:PAS domain S-box-containing protein